MIKTISIFFTLALFFFIPANISATGTNDTPPCIPIYGGVCPTPTPAPTATPAPTVTPAPTATPAPAVTPSPTATPVPQGAQNITINCPDGRAITVTAGEDVNFNVLCQAQQQSQTQENNQTVNVNQTQSTPGVVFATAPAGGPAVVIPVASPSGQVAGIAVKELPKTGLPELLWAVLGLIPVGFGLRRFALNYGNNQEQKDHAGYIWQIREFLKGGEK